jgi:hypothetical protein
MMREKEMIIFFLALVACGKPAAKGLAYSDPAGSGWRLVKNPASNSALMVLDLLPPAGEAGRGVALTLRADPRLGWPQDVLRMGTVYDLGAAPKAVMADLRGQDAVLGVFQKGQTAPAPYGDGSHALFSVALSLGALQQPARGTALPIEVRLARHLGSTGQFEDIAGRLQVGALTAE